MQTVNWIVVMVAGLTSFFLGGKWTSSAQVPDTTVNNLHLPSGYVTSDYGSIPEFRKIGRGKRVMILIPGLGFDGSVFDDFAKNYSKKYTCYLITVPGFGKSRAPSLPTPATSYGEQYWNKGVLQGLGKLMESEKISDAVVVGSFVQGVQLALRMAIDYPEKVSRVIAIGGAAKFIYMNKGSPTEFPLPGLIDYTDKVIRNHWFRNMPAKDFNKGNYAPEIYSLDSAINKSLWNQPAEVPTSVMVEYLCEFIASDVTLDAGKITCPVLAIRPGFNQRVLAEPVNNYVKPQFIDAWDTMRAKNPAIHLVDISDAGCFVWKDKPALAYAAIDAFLGQ